MSNKKEVVVCAAVRYTLVSKDSLRSMISTFMCVDYDDHFFKDAQGEMERVEYFDIAIRAKGFITSNKRFVTPEEALTITGMQNQLKFKDRKYLLPGDLY